MRRFSFSWALIASIALFVIAATGLIYSTRSLSSQSTARRLPLLNSPSAGASLQINTAASTSTFPASTATQNPNSQSAGSTNPQAASTPASQSTNPVQPAACKYGAISTGQCRPIFCPERVMSDGYDSCGCRGPEMSQIACLVQ